MRSESARKKKFKLEPYIEDAIVVTGTTQGDTAVTVAYLIIVILLFQINFQITNRTLFNNDTKSFSKSNIVISEHRNTIN